MSLCQVLILVIHVKIFTRNNKTRGCKEAWAYRVSFSLNLLADFKSSNQICLKSLELRIVTQIRVRLMTILTLRICPNLKPPLNGPKNRYPKNNIF